jgi:hypothetical protein
MKKKLLYMLPLIAMGGMTLLSNTKENFAKVHQLSVDGVSFSSNPNLGLTGAPGEGNCTQCHSGNTIQSASATSGMTSTLSEYELGETYTFALGSVGNTVNGFQMTILDNDGNKSGSFVAGAANTNIANANDKEYIRQSLTAQAWTFDWTAPLTDKGPLTAYYSLLESDGQGGTADDVLYLGSQSISSAQTNGLTNHEMQDKKIEMFFNDQHKELNVKFNLSKKAKVFLQVVDLSGKVVESVDLGSKSFGPHSKKIQFENIQKEGIYVVSLFVNNDVYNRKVYFK